MSQGNYRGPGVYRHFRGGEYEVLGLSAREESFDNSSDTTIDVVYRPVKFNPRCKVDFVSRRLESFNDIVDDGAFKERGHRVPRFKLVGPPKMVVAEDGAEHHSLREMRSGDQPMPRPETPSSMVSQS